MRGNAYAERVVRTIRAECTDRMLITGSGTSSACSPGTSGYNTARAYRALNTPDQVAQEKDLGILGPALFSRVGS